MMKLKIFIFLIISTVFSNTFVYAEDLIIQSEIIPWNWSETIIKVWWDTWTDLIDNIFNTIISYIFWLTALVAVAVFIYIGYLFITSGWNEEQSKKAWKTLLYAIIWIAVISLSWGIVKLITTIVL